LRDRHRRNRWRTLPRNEREPCRTNGRKERTRN